jgi:hypothetical protein
LSAAELKKEVNGAIAELERELKWSRRWRRDGLSEDASRDQAMHHMARLVRSLDKFTTYLYDMEAWPVGVLMRQYERICRDSTSGDSRANRTHLEVLEYAVPKMKGLADEAALEVRTLAKEIHERLGAGFDLFSNDAPVTRKLELVS